MKEIREALSQALHTDRIKDVKELDSKLDIFFLLDHETPVTDGHLVSEQPGVYVVYNASYVIIKAEEDDEAVFEIHIANPNNLGPLQSKLAEPIGTKAVA